MAVVTASAGFATLLVGFSTFLSPQQDMPSNARWLLLAALVFFSLAAGLGVWTNKPQMYKEAKVTSLEDRVSHKTWHKPDPAEAYRRDAELISKIIIAARPINGRKAKGLTYSLALAALALECLAGAVAIVVLLRP